ncbi:hypothetical protein LP089_08300 [Moraxella bovis]|uniref:PilC/PilY family type IV pilus protein n=1 Tax=Moraxella bovis TaxID=476 RepID=UPI0022272370|nr:PilC/PilY family type IV pilus protein [Moraxella bovis]UYZ70135.1 hypothetical protein LP089_08300 [Moraxella bovis]
MKKFKKNTLSTQLTRVSIATIMAMTTMSAHASTKQIGDLEIYQPAKSANTNLMMMLDTSGSMGISSLVLPKTNKYGSPGDVDQSLCGRTTGAFKQWVYDAKDTRTGETYGRTAFKKSVTVEGETINYYLRGCGTATIDASGKLIESESGKFDRLSRLKESLIQLIASDTIDKTVSIGLGNFSSKTPIKIGDSQNTLVDGHSGTILVPVKPLTKEHRLDLIRTLAAFKSVDVATNEDGTPNPNLAGNSTNYPNIFKASSGTPTAHAYAEAGAYMLGTGTGRDSNIEKAKTLNILYDGSVVMQKTGGTEQVYYICVELGTANTARQFGAMVRQCANGWNDKEIRKDTGRAFGAWYDASKKTIGSNIPVYKPDSNGGWTLVSRDELIRTAGYMNSPWETHSKLPVGWRYAGWMKVDNEPMDIEPINTKGWGNPGGATAYVSYRASPFIVTSTTEGAETCDAGYTYSSTPYDRDGNYKCKSNTLAEAITGWSSSLACPSWYSNCQPVQSRLRRVLGTWGYTNRTQYYRMGYHLKEAAKSIAVNEYQNNIGGMRYAGIKHDLNGDGTNDLNVTVRLKDDNNYQEPDNTVGECSSNGIYFLTDGAPNSTTDDMARQIINRTLGNKSIPSKPAGLTSPALTSGLFEGETGGWEYIGEYAKRLREPAQNPSGVKIRTAVAGFGASFAGLSSSENENGQTIYDCDSGEATLDAKNACRWGNIGSGYGEGGFFYTQSADDIARSIKVFLNTLNTSLPTAPAGTITIPNDPYQASNQQAIAFLPMLQPDVSSASSIWQGNLKKYEIGTVTNGVSDVANEGTFFGKNKAHLYQADGVSLSKVAQDFWSDKDYPDANDAVTSGGVYANLKLPNRSALDGVRTVFVEDGDTLKKFGVNASGKLTLNDNELSADNTFADTKLYTPANVQHLLRFLGFVNVDVPANLADTVVTADNVADSKIMGGVVHSSPSFVSYSATVNADGEVTDERDEYVLFGSMDGALHMVDSDNFSESGSGGKEQFAIITKQMLLKQPEALSASVSGESEGVGKPKFGVDAPWLVTATYTYQDGKLVAQSTEPTAPQGKSYNTLSGVNAFGGFRLGAKGLYGLDLTDKNEPRLRFAFLPTSEGADRLGYIWNKPTLARIKTGANDMGTDVLVFGGGYDMCYEDENFQVGEGTGSDACKVKPYADGSAIYIINAKTGALIWKASSETIRDMKHSIVGDMKHSIVGEIAVLDRNNDGFMDHLYAADLGGQIFRADFTNASSTRDSFAARGVVRVFHEPGEGVYTRRFYEKPQVNIYTETKRFATVSVISGDRSSPLSKLRGNTTTADRLYTLFDTDITKTNREFNALNSSTYQVKDITPANLEALGDVNGGQKDTHLQKIKAFITNSNPTEAVKKGWYYPLNRFDGYTNVRYGKGVGKLEVVSGLLNNKRSSFLYTTVYNPDMSYTKTDSCSAQIKGGSERQFYCMPWGICENTSTGLAGYQRAGIGIQELARGPASKANSSKVLLSSMLGAYHAENNYNKASSSIVTAQSGVPNPNGVTGWTNPIAIPDLISGGQSESTAYTLTPKQWYDVSATK